MAKLILLKFERGNFQDGFEVTLRMSEDSGDNLSWLTEISGQFPPSPNIPELYQQWYSDYETLDKLRISVKKGHVGHTDDIPKQCAKSAKDFKNAFKNWLFSENRAFQQLREKIQAEVNPQEILRIIIQTEDALLRKLPWHEWDLVADIYTKAEIALSAKDFEQPTLKSRQQTNVRILGILGDSTGINVEKDRQILTEQLPNVDITFLSEPPRSQLSDALWEQDWMILFFSGHSSSDKGGIIRINPSDELSIHDLKYGLRKSIEHGLHLAIFNSCDGLKLAEDLADLNLPQIIVMREPVPDQVAQAFLKFFLHAFYQEQSLHLAVRRARERLHDDGWEEKYPGACGLPVIWQHPTVKPLTYNDLLTHGPNPYKGLSAFEQQDADRFFGREGLIEKLYNKINKLHTAIDNPLRWLSIQGPSGSGKSSVAQAGLLFTLTQHPLPAWLGDMRAIVFTPGAHPLETLARALTQLDPRIEPISVDDKADELADKMANQSERLRRFADHLPDQRPLVILVDQFEEIYTHCKAEAQRTAEQAETERTAFIDNLMVAAADRNATTSVIITLRSDFLRETQHHLKLNHTLCDTDRMEIVPVMGRDELDRAIRKPTQLAGQSLDSAVILELVNQTLKHEGALPLLQFALTQIWEESITKHRAADEVLNDIGGVGGALSYKAEAIYQQLSPSQQKIAQRAFLKLVALGEEDKYLRRRIPVENLVATGENSEDVYEVLRRFAQPEARLITLSKDEKDRVIAEVTHEALFEHWNTLKEWLEANKDDLRFRKRLNEATQHWKDQKKPDGLLWRSPDLDELRKFYQRNPSDMTKVENAFFQTSEKRQRKNRLYKNLAITGLMILTVISLIVSFWADSERENARQAESVAQQERVKAEKQAIISKIEAQSIDALAQFQAGAGEIESLLSAMDAGQKLRTFLNENQIQKLQDYPTVRPILTLQTILNNIREKNLFKVDQVQVNSVDFSPDGQMIATGGYDGTVRLFTLSGQELTKWQAYPQWVEHLEFSPDGRFIITGKSANRNRYHLWELSGESTAIQGKQIAEWKNENLYDINLDFSFSYDGKKMAGILGGSVRLWDFSGKQITQIKLDPTVEGRQIVYGNLLDNQWHSRGANCIDFSPDSKQLVIGSALGDIQIYNLSEYQKMKQFKAYGKTIESVSFSPSGQYILSRGVDRTEQVPGRQETYDIHATRLWNLSGQQITELHPDAQGIFLNESFSPNGKQIVTVGEDAIVRLWDLSGKQIDQFKGHLGAVRAVSFSPNGQLIATGGKDGNIRLWNLPKKPVIQLAGYPAMIGLNFSQDGKKISIAGVLDNTIRIYNLSGMIAEFKGTPDNIATTITRPTVDGEHFVNVASTGIKERRAALYDLSGNLISELKIHMDRDMDFPIINRSSGKYISFRTFSASFDGHIVATIGNDFQTRIWDFSRQQVIELKDTQNAFSSYFRVVRVSLDGKYILTIGAEDSIVRLWNSSGKPLVKLDGTVQNPKKIVEAVGLGVVLNGQGITQIVKNSPAMKAGIKADDIIVKINGKYISNDDEIYPLLNGEEGTQVTLHIVRGKSGNTQGLDFSLTREKVKFVFGKTYTDTQFSPNGKYIATWNQNGDTVQLWDILGNPITELTKLDRVSDVSFSPNRELIAIQGLGNSVQIWDFYGKLITELKGFQGPSAARFSPDGQRIATLGGDNKVRVWDVLGRKIAQFEYTFSDFLLTFSPDGKYIAAKKSDNAAITLLPIEELEELLALGCNWLKDYFHTHPEVQNTLYVCQDRFILAKIEENLLKAKEIEKANVKLHIEQGRNFAEVGEFENALTEFQKAQELEPNLGFDPETEARQIAAQAWLKKGVTLAQNGKIEEANAAYIKAEKINPMIPADYWYFLCWKGSSDSFHRNPLKVMDACDKAIEGLKIENILDPTNADAYRDARGLALAQTDHIAAAIEDFEAFINWIDRNEGRFSNDEARILRAQKLQRQYWLNALRQGENPFLDNGDFALLNLSKEFRVDFYYLGQVAEWENDLSNALHWYKKVNQGTNYLNARTWVAVILNTQGKFEEAIEYLHSLSLFGKEELELSLVQTVVDFVFYCDSYTEAMEIYGQKKLNGYPSLRTLFIRAMLAYKMDNLIEYEQYLRKLIEMDQKWQTNENWKHEPSVLYTNALNHLGYTLANRTNRYQEAYDLLKQALDLQPENPYVLDSMGWVLYKMGKYQDAIEHLRKAQANINASIPPEVAAENAVHLGEVLWVSGDKEAAKTIWEKARKDFPENEKLREVMRRFLETPTSTSETPIPNQ